MRVRLPLDGLTAGAGGTYALALGAGLLDALEEADAETEGDAETEIEGVGVGVGVIV